MSSPSMKSRSSKDSGKKSTQDGKDIKEKVIEETIDNGMSTPPEQMIRSDVGDDFVEEDSNKEKDEHAMEVVKVEAVADPKANVEEANEMDVEKENPLKRDREEIEGKEDAAAEGLAQICERASIESAQVVENDSDTSKSKGKKKGSRKSQGNASKKAKVAAKEVKNEGKEADTEDEEKRSDPVPAKQKKESKKPSPQRKKNVETKEAKALYLVHGIDGAVSDIARCLANSDGANFKCTRDINEVTHVIVQEGADLSKLDDPNALIAIMKQDVQVLSSGIIFAALEEGSKWLNEGDDKLEKKFLLEGIDQLRDRVLDMFKGKSIFFPPFDSKVEKKQKALTTLMNFTGAKIVSSVRNADICIQVQQKDSKSNQKDEESDDSSTVKDWSKRYPTVQFRTCQWLFELFSPKIET